MGLGSSPSNFLKTLDQSGELSPAPSQERFEGERTDELPAATGWRFGDDRVVMRSLSCFVRLALCTAFKLSCTASLSAASPSSRSAFPSAFESSSKFAIFCLCEASRAFASTYVTVTSTCAFWKECSREIISSCLAASSATVAISTCQTPAYGSKSDSSATSSKSMNMHSKGSISNSATVINSCNCFCFSTKPPVPSMTAAADSMLNFSERQSSRSNQHLGNAIACRTRKTTIHRL